MNTRQSLCILLAVCLAVVLFPMPAAAAPVRQSACAAMHTVQPGENLFRISLKYNVAIAAIMQANGLLNPNYVYVGQVLCIPGAYTPPPAPPPAPAPAPQPIPTSGRYCVQPGDTLSGIAVRFGTTTWALVQANGLANANYIYVGQCLNIPTGCCPAQPVQPAKPASSGNWKGEYFDNPHLAGSPKWTRYDAAINFDWGSGSPSSKVPVDNFSVRWTRTVYLEAARYRFTVTVDDGARLWVDDQLLIDQWGQHAATTFTQDADLGKGYHTFRLEYQDLTGPAMAILGWVRVADSEQGSQGPAVSGAWLGGYFNGVDLGATPDVQRLDPAIDFDWRDKSPFPGEIDQDFFSARWIRNVYFEAGLYRFSAWVDDGVRLYVDNELVIDEWRDANGVVWTGDAPIKAGVHEVKVEYYERAYDAMISVWWEKIK